MQGASLLNGLEFDPLTFFQDSLAGPIVDVVRDQIVQALMIPPCVVVLDEPSSPRCRVWLRASVSSLLLLEQ